MAQRHPPVCVSVLLNARGLAPFYSHLHSISAMVLWLRINNTFGCKPLPMLPKIFPYGCLLFDSGPSPLLLLNATDCYDVTALT